MEFNRYHYFVVGLIVLLFGIQLRLVESYLLNEETTRWLMQQSGDAGVQVVSKVTEHLPTAGGGPRKTVVPPDWLGWAMISFGSVLVLHSLALPKPS